MTIDIIFDFDFLPSWRGMSLSFYFDGSHTTEFVDQVSTKSLKNLTIIFHFDIFSLLKQSVLIVNQTQESNWKTTFQQNHKTIDIIFYFNLLPSWRGISLGFYFVWESQSRIGTKRFNKITKNNWPSTSSFILTSILYENKVFSFRLHSRQDTRVELEDHVLTKPLEATDHGHYLWFWLLPFMKKDVSKFSFCLGVSEYTTFSCFTLSTRHNNWMGRPLFNNTTSRNWTSSSLILI